MQLYILKICAAFVIFCILSVANKYLIAHLSHIDPNGIISAHKY